MLNLFYPSDVSYIYNLKDVSYCCSFRFLAFQTFDYEGYSIKASCALNQIFTFLLNCCSNTGLNTASKYYIRQVYGHFQQYFIVAEYYITQCIKCMLFQISIVHVLTVSSFHQCILSTSVFFPEDKLLFFHPNSNPNRKFYTPE